MSTTTLRPSAPERSPTQRLEALAIANQIRTRRKLLKRDLKAGRQSLTCLLADPPPDWLESMKVIDLLLALPKVGRVKAAKTLNAGKISPAKTVGGLTDRQRDALIEVLGRRGLGYGPLRDRDTAQSRGSAMGRAR